MYLVSCHICLSVPSLLHKRIHDQGGLWQYERVRKSRRWHMWRTLEHPRSLCQVIFRLKLVVLQVPFNFGLLIGICSVKSNAPVMQRELPFLASASFHSNMMESSTTLAQPPIRKTAKPGVPMRLIWVSFACVAFLRTACIPAFKIVFTTHLKMVLL